MQAATTPKKTRTFPALLRGAAGGLVISSVAFAAAAGGAGDKVLAVASETADGCVTRAEADAVARGWARSRVHRLFGTAGELLSRQEHEYTTRAPHGVRTTYVDHQLVRTYKGCDRPGVVTIGFEKLGREDRAHFRVVAANAVWFSGPFSVKL